MDIVTWSNSKINLGLIAQEKALFVHIFHSLIEFIKISNKFVNHIHIYIYIYNTILMQFKVSFF